MDTIPKLMRKAAQADPDKIFLYWIDPSKPDLPPVKITYRDFETMIRQTARILKDNGIGRGKRVLILGQNSPAWQALAMGTQCLRGEAVGVSTHLGEEELASIVLRVQPEVLFVSEADPWKKIQRILSQLSSLSLVLATDPIHGLPKGIFHFPITRISSMEPLSEATYQDLLEKVSLQDPFMTLFTSGTSGRHKGVRLSQGAFGESLAGGAESLRIGKEDLGFQALPLAHVAGQCVFHVVHKTQGNLILCSRREDVLRGISLGPTYSLLVPFFFEKIWKEVIHKIHQKPRFFSKLLEYGIYKGDLYHPRKLFSRAISKIVSALIGKKIRSQLGGRMHLLVAGGCPFRPQDGPIFSQRGL